MAVILEAMKRAGADVTRESIVKELRNTKMDGLMGLVEFDETGRAEGAVALPLQGGRRRVRAGMAEGLTTAGASHDLDGSPRGGPLPLR